MSTQRMIALLGVCLCWVGLSHCGPVVSQEPDAKEPPHAESVVDASKPEQKVEQKREATAEREADCSEGESKSCYSGPPGTQGVGICQAGKMQCKDGRWTSCIGQVTPKPDEYCKDNLDNDCDGQVDEGCGICKDGETQSCYTGKTGCEKIGKVYACHAPCKAGKQTCIKGQWSKCEGEKVASEEVCDGIDNDCDGQTDDIKDKGQPCQETGQPGICKEGKWDCKLGSKVCVPNLTPEKETCDGIDNNCDGQIDNGLTAPSCQKSQGVCAGLKQQCGGTQGWIACTEADYAKHSTDYQPKETQCDKKDNDCDGNVDEGCKCVDGTTQPCYDKGAGCQQSGGKFTCHGPCKTGVQSCKGGVWGTCVGAVGGTKEVCDGQDNDCDGKVDNNLVAPKCANQQGVCAGAKKVCGGTKGWLSCTSADFSKHNNLYQTKETKCDGLDNDCDGKVDNGLTPPLCAKTKGVCAGLKKVCRGAKGWASCTDADYARHHAAYEAKETKCDGLDNDCDGQIDNGLTPPLCSKQQGVCQGAVKTCGGMRGWLACSAAEYGKVSSAYQTFETICGDQKDNDCDGKVDYLCVTTLAGSAGQAGYADGKGSAARFRNPRGIAVDMYGHVYVADTGNHLIRKIDTLGNVTTVAGFVDPITKTPQAGYKDALIDPLKAMFRSPEGIVFTANSRGMYIADTGNHAIRYWGISTQEVKTSISNSLDTPRDVLLVFGILFIADMGNQRIVKNSGGSLSAFVQGTYFVGLAYDSSGNHIYTSHSIDAQMQKDGEIIRLDSSGKRLGVAPFQGPRGMAFFGGKLYVADEREHVIRAFDPKTGTNSVFVGTSMIPGSADGEGTKKALLSAPWDVAFDSSGSYMYIADTGNHTIRKVKIK